MPGGTGCHLVVQVSLLAIPARERVITCEEVFELGSGSLACDGQWRARTA